jgi:Flp pilus assembly protein TadG
MTPSLVQRWRRNEAGAAALEFAIVAAAFIVVSIGLVEFGRALQVRNEMAFAMDRGARIVHINHNAEPEVIKSAILNAFSLYDKNKLAIDIAEESEAVVVSLSYPLEIFIPGFAGTVNIGMPPRRVPRIDDDI